MRPILENIFRFLVNKLELFLYDGLFFPRCKKMNELGGEGHHKRGMYESFLSSKVMIIEQVLSKLKD